MKQEPEGAPRSGADRNRLRSRRRGCQSLTLRGVLKAGVGLRTAARVALAADTLSIAVMELVDNGVLVLWPGAMGAELDDPLFWGALAIALAIAFVVTTPVNKWTIGRGKGHAVVHRYHH